MPKARPAARRRPLVRVTVRQAQALAADLAGRLERIFLQAGLSRPALYHGLKFVRDELLPRHEQEVGARAVEDFEDQLRSVLADLDDDVAAAVLGALRQHVTDRLADMADLLLADA